MAEFVPLLPSRRTNLQNTAPYDAETFVSPGPAPVPADSSAGPAGPVISVLPPPPMVLVLCAILFFYALLNIFLVAMARESVPGWLYQSLFATGLIVALGVTILVLLRFV